MFIAMNRFQVIPGREERLNQIWPSRGSHGAGVPGFVGFHRLRRPAADDHMPSYRTPPRFEGFDVSQTVTPS